MSRARGRHADDRGPGRSRLHRRPGDAAPPGRRARRRLHPGPGAGRSTPVRHRHRRLRRPDGQRGRRAGRRSPSRASRRCSPWRWPSTGWTRRCGPGSGREPSGSPFNSIVQLEQEKGIPRNPFINAGRAGGHRRGDRRAAGPARRSSTSPASCAAWPWTTTVSIDPEVAASEEETGFRNASLAYFLRGVRQSAQPGDRRAGGLFQPVRPYG